MTTISPVNWAIQLQTENRIEQEMELGMMCDVLPLTDTLS